MEKIIEDILLYLTMWIQANVLTWSMVAQWLCAGSAFFLALIFWAGVTSRIKKWTDKHVSGDLANSALNALIHGGNLVLFIILAQICAAVFVGMDKNPQVLNALSYLAVAGIVIRLLTGLMTNRTLARWVTIMVWTIAALHIFGMLSPISKFLKGLSFSMGKGDTFTALGAIKGVLLAALFLQVASLTVQFVTKRIERNADLSPSLKVLTVKTVKIVLFTAAILFSMSSVGIDLTSLAIFSSALGVGIGFGLKTIISNYVAGVLLLMDNSIKPGDTIEVGSVFGVVHDMHGRYTSVLTRDGMEYLIPNELLITGEVVNWTYSDKNVRLKIPVGISYQSDIELALKLLEKVHEGVDRVLDDPHPASRLVGFGDSSVDLQLRIWIADAEKGVTNVRSEVLLNIWKLFHKHGIDFPFPQREILLKSDSALTVKIEKDSDK